MTIRIIIVLISVFLGSSFQVPPSLAPPSPPLLRSGGTTMVRIVVVGLWCAEKRRLCNKIFSKRNMLFCLLAQLNSNGPRRTQQKGAMESTLNKNSGDMTDQGPFWRATNRIVWFHCFPCHLTQFLIDVGCVNVKFLWHENWVLTRKTTSPEDPTWLLILSDPLNIICCLSYWSLTGRGLPI
jgi:hypothetical protein